MTDTHLTYGEDLIEKAHKLIQKSEEELKGYSPNYSNIIVDCQTAIELIAKAIFKIMNLDFPEEHQLLFEKGDKVKKVTRELFSKEFPKDFAYKEELPRLVFLTYFWHRFYTIAKYGIDELNIPPDRLFKREDAELAVNHAKRCREIVDNLLIFKKIEEGK